MPDTVEKAESSHDEHKSSFAARTKEGEEHSPLDNGEGVYDATGSSMRRFSRIDSCRRPPRGIGVAQAVIGLANDLAKVSQVPGVAEVAGLVDVLMKLKADSSNFIEAGDYTEKRCRAVLLLLQRAAGVLNEVGYHLSSGLLSAKYEKHKSSVSSASNAQTRIMKFRTTR